MYKINPTGYAPTITSNTNSGEGLANWGGNGSNNSLLMNYMSNNILIVEDVPKNVEEKKDEFNK